MDNTEQILWTAGFFNERFPEPVSPLGWSVVGPLIETLALCEPLRYLGFPEADRIPILRLWHGHPYTNVEVFQTLYKVFPDWLLPEDAYRYFPGGDVTWRRRASFPSSILSPRLLVSVLRSFLSDPMNWSPLHNYRRWTTFAKEHDDRVSALKDRIAALERTGVRLPEILAALGEVDELHRDLLRIHRWSLVHADLTFGVLKRLVRSWVDREHAGEIVSHWVSGVPNKTMEVDSALRRLAVTAHESPGLGAVVERATTFDEFVQLCKQGNETPDRSAAASRFLNLLDSFLSEHGHRSFSLDIAVPTFADDPMQVVCWLRSLGNEDRSPAKEARSGPLDLSTLPSWKRWILRGVRSLAVRYVALREDQRYYWQKSLALTRRLYLLAADILRAAGVIAERTDVFYATHGDLVAFAEKAASGAELSDRIVARRTEWSTFVQEFRQAPASSYPAFLGGSEPPAPTPTEPEAWQARAVSPGTARGAARVVRSVSDLARVQSGEILVAPSTDPAWTPVFGRIAGLVLERGGVLSHGAVVAREYGVPAVAGITNIAEQIRNGEVIEVDGNSGRVTRVA